MSATTGSIFFAENAFLPARAATRFTAAHAIQRVVQNAVLRRASSGPVKRASFPSWPMHRRNTVLAESRAWQRGGAETEWDEFDIANMERHGSFYFAVARKRGRKKRSRKRDDIGRTGKKGH
jgi:hypothetical protein